ncbi:MAG: V-type ATP synthase subunit E [Anaerolineaceae bacterium]
MTQDENLDRLSRDILQQAQSEAEQIIAEAKEKAALIRRHAQEQAAAERISILEQAQRDSDRIRSQAIATTQLKARTLLLESRERLLTEVFEAAQKKLSSVQQWNDYEAIIEKLVEEAISQMGTSNVILSADPITSKLLTDPLLKKIGSKFDNKIELGESLKNKIGISASTTNGHLNYDNTLETRLKKLSNELRSPVYHLLMGESL